MRPNPQLKLQLGEKSVKPARMPAGLHSHTHLHPLCRKITVEFLRFLAVLQSPLLQFPSLGIHKSNLLEARVIIASYSDHCLAPSSRAFWLVSTTKFALLANTIATGAALVALILTFGPISGAHLNPAVTFADAIEHGISWPEAVAYMLVQCAGGVAGAITAHLMFGLRWYSFLTFPAWVGVGSK